MSGGHEASNPACPGVQEGGSMPAAETRSPRGTRAPDGTVDTHIHIYGPADRYPAAPTAGIHAVAGASLDAYRALMERLNIARCVVVQPSTYGADNRCTMDAVAALGLDRARAVVVVTPDTDGGRVRPADQGGRRRHPLLHAARRRAALGVAARDGCPRPPPWLARPAPARRPRHRTAHPHAAPPALRPRHRPHGQVRRACRHRPPGLPGAPLADRGRPRLGQALGPLRDLQGGAAALHGRRPSGAS